MNKKYEQLLFSVFDRIESELLRLYWNKYQKDMSSPFLNTGNEYHNDTFSVSAYYWGEDENEQNRPNFRYKDFKAHWYKHAHRGLFVDCLHEVDAEFLSEMLNDCLESLYNDKEIGETYE